MFHTPNQLYFQKVSLLVHQLKRSLEFYHDILGFHIIDQTKTTVGLSANGKDVLIELVEDVHAKPLGLTQGLYHYALLLEKRGELALVIKHLVEKRYPISGASDHGVSEAIYLDDPDGHGIEIYADKPRDMWPLENGDLTMFTKPLDLDSLMKELPPNTPYSLPEKTNLGHLHFHVPDLPEVKRFYVDVIGFQVVLYYGSSALFISDQGYHHHLGLNTWQRDAPLCEKRQIGLKAYVLNIPEKEYLPLLKRLNDAHVELMTEDDFSYVIDPLGQKLIFNFNQ